MCTMWKNVMPFRVAWPSPGCKSSVSIPNNGWRLRITVNGSIAPTWQAFMRPGKPICMEPVFAEHNDKKRFLLTIVDVLSRFAFVRPLQRKTPAEVVAAFESVVRHLNDFVNAYNARFHRTIKMGMVQNMAFSAFSHIEIKGRICHTQVVCHGTVAPGLSQHVRWRQENLGYPARLHAHWVTVRC